MKASFSNMKVSFIVFLEVSDYLIFCHLFHFLYFIIIFYILSIANILIFSYIFKYMNLLVSTF